MKVRKHRGTVEIEHISSEGTLNYVVAVASDRQVFFLKGASSSAKEFNSLAENQGVTISQNNAISYYQFWLSVNSRNYTFPRTESLDDLKREVDELYRAQEAHLKCPGCASRWLKRQEALLDEITLTPLVTPIPKGFLVTFVSLSRLPKGNPFAGPSLIRGRVLLSRSGAFGNPVFEPIKLRSKGK